MEQSITNFNIQDLVAFLSHIDITKNMDETALNHFASILNPIFVEGGTTLIKQGDIDRSMYFLFQGRLRVNAQEDVNNINQKEFVLAEIAAGQFVGEIALLTHLPRSTTVKVIRDSILLKLEESAFLAFEKKYPAVVNEISKLALKRIAKKTRFTQVGENFVTLAIAPAGKTDSKVLSPQLLQALNKYKPTFLLSKKVMKNHFGRDLTESSEEADRLLMTQWQQELENQYGYLLLETDPELSAWTSYCLRQSDRILFVADHAKNPSLNSIESHFYSQSNLLKPYNEIAFIHPEETTTIEGTEEWLKARDCMGYYHLKLQSEHLFNRLIRCLTGQALGVVLNGGGARGLVHIGVLKALEEMNVPVDFIGGTSMGALISGLYACFGLKRTISLCQQKLVQVRNEFTLPIIALSKGKFPSEQYKKIWDDKKIEDLWMRYYAIATNLTESQIEIMDRGPIWLAVRSSTSIPGIYPPIYDEEGNMLVDGGIVNNMPVDVMRKMICGGKILAVNCHIKFPAILKKRVPNWWVSGWEMLYHILNPFKVKKIQYDNIVNILYASFDLSIENKQAQMRKEADYYLEIDTKEYHQADFKSIDKLIEIGYTRAMQALPTLLK